MTETYNWTRFYQALCRYGPNLLTGIDDEARELVEIESSSTDMFWSDGLEDLLSEGFARGDVRAGVLSALELWRENVLVALDENFGISLNWKEISIDATNPLIDKLVLSATGS